MSAIEPIREDPINLKAVRCWAVEHGVRPAGLRSAYRMSYCLAVGRLVQALYRERLCETHVVEHSQLGTCLALGAPPALLVPVAAKTFVRLDVRGWPACYRSDLSPIEWSGAFLRELRQVLRSSALAEHLQALARDFRNSLANLILNRLLSAEPHVVANALEPAYQGHHYYPFPGLRVGPSVDQVAACSHLIADSVEVPLLELSALAFRSAVFASAADCFSAWAGVHADAAERTIPVHPWQLTISPVAAGLLAANAARATARTLRCKPLCSQRTMRVQATGYDIKLAVDAAITSEHRLLYRLNSENAPAVSALVTRLLATRAPAAIALDIQPDVASLSFADTRFAAHLAAIVRTPIRVGTAERVLPAIDLWTGRETAATVLHGASVDEVNAFFERYCRTLLTGPVAFLFHFGLAFEPHLQNSVIVFRGREPVRLIIRDLDGTIMDATRVPQLLSELNLEVAADTWEHMPLAEIGEHRLVHSLFFGHIVEVVDFLTLRCGAARNELMSILGREWARLPAIVNVRGANERFSTMCEHLEKGKSMLIGRLAKSTKMTFVDLPQDTPFEEASQCFWREL